MPKASYVVITNFSIVLTILLVFASFVLINAYAATLTVNLENQQNQPDFTAVVTGSAAGGGRDEIQFNQGGSAIFDVNAGEYRISILSNAGLAFSVDVLNDDECDGIIGSDNDNEVCDVVLGNRFDDGGFGASGIPTGSEGFGVDVVASPEALANTKTGEELIRNDEISDPPFRSCEAFEVKSEGAEKDKSVKFIRSPSSAEYYIKGAVSGERLKSIIQENGRSDATFSIVNDLHQIDNYPISNEINSKYLGQLIYYKENGAKKEVLNFRIDNINTECRYITLIQPSEKFSASQKNQWTPLTEEGKEKFEKHAIPGDKNAFEQIGMPAYNENQLMSGEAVLKFPTRTEPLSVLGLNPPFGPCVAVVESLGFKDDDNDGLPDPESGEIDVTERDDAQFAEYVMIGNLKDKISSANKNGNEDLLIKITADLNLLASDSAKITGNANPYVKTEIFLNPDQDPAQKIDFYLKELSYSCHGVGFAR